VFRQRGQWRQWVEGLAQKFREKGATSPEKAMTAAELGVHEMFEQAMKRRLGQTGIFVEVGGRYYLDEARFMEFEQRRLGAGTGYGGTGARGNMFAIRIVRMILGVVIVSLVLVNLLYGRTLEVWYAVVVLVVVWIAISVVQMGFLAGRRF
jgi:hypothetical protein